MRVDVDDAPGYRARLGLTRITPRRAGLVQGRTKARALATTWLLALATLASAVGTAGAARAQPASSTHRAVGLGGAMGAGPRAWASPYPSSSGEGENLELEVFPTFELAFALGDEVNLEVSVPLVETVVGATFESFLWRTSFFLTWLVGGPTAYFVVGPGLGFDVSSQGHVETPIGTSRRVSGGDVRGTAIIGLELLTDDRYFAFRVQLRPWITAGGGDLGAVVNGGALLELESIGFF